MQVNFGLSRSCEPVRLSTLALSLLTWSSLKFRRTIMRYLYMRIAEIKLVRRFQHKSSPITLGERSNTSVEVLSSLIRTNGNRPDQNRGPVTDWIHFRKSFTSWNRISSMGRIQQMGSDDRGATLSLLAPPCELSLLKCDERNLDINCIAFGKGVLMYIAWYYRLFRFYPWYECKNEHIMCL